MLRRIVGWFCEWWLGKDVEGWDLGPF